MVKLDLKENELYDYCGNDKESSSFIDAIAELNISKNNYR